MQFTFPFYHYFSFNILIYRLGVQWTIIKCVYNDDVNHLVHESYNNIFTSTKFDSLYFVRKLIVQMETDMTEMNTPRLSIIRNLHRP